MNKEAIELLERIFKISDTDEPDEKHGYPLIKTLANQVLGLLKQQPPVESINKDLLEACEEGVMLSPGWREVIAELDDMAKTEVVGKAMWACLDQIDIWKKKVTTVIAKAKKEGEMKQS